MGIQNNSVAWLHLSCTMTHPDISSIPISLWLSASIDRYKVSRWYDAWTRPIPLSHVIRFQRTMDRAILTRTSSGYKSLKRAPSSESTVKMPITRPNGNAIKRRRKLPTFFLMYLLFMSTLGPLQFGYHLVSFQSAQHRLNDLDLSFVGRTQCPRTSHQM